MRRLREEIDEAKNDTSNSENRIVQLEKQLEEQKNHRLEVIRYYESRSERLFNENRRLRESLKEAEEGFEREEKEKLWYKGKYEEINTRINSELNESIECPICFKVMKDTRPAILCENGHSFCHLCFVEIFKDSLKRRNIAEVQCPTCRSVMDLFPVRNLALTEIGQKLSPYLVSDA